MNEKPESLVVKLLTHKDPTALQLAAPILIIEEWDKATFLLELEQAAKNIQKLDPNINLIARATALCSVSLLLLDIAPTWGLWRRIENKRELVKTLDELKKRDFHIGNDPWQSPDSCEYPEELDTEIFKTSCGWKTHWPLCDFLREIEVYKNHKYY